MAMTISWLKQIDAHLAENQPVCRIVIADAKGSTPREAGADMLIRTEQITGTIGGGRLEYEAIAIARNLMEKAARNTKSGFIRHWQRFALGPSLGQCCGGAVMILFEAYAPSARDAVHDMLGAEQNIIATYHGADNTRLPQLISATDNRTKDGYDTAAGAYCQSIKSQRRPLYLYGAGHVGRAVMAVTGQLGFDRNWVDDAPTRFPDHAADIDDDITVIPASDMTIIARHAPADSYHLVMSYSHQMDAAIVQAILGENRFARLGLIGSATKRARFATLLKQAGITDNQLARMNCPVGLAAIKGKAPERVALSIAAQLAIWLDEDENEAENGMQI
jgi:xanthine dehydrogenase accessory factor